MDFPLVVAGLGCAATPADPTPYLRARKQRKFMGVQDDLAVVAAGRALESAGLAGQPLGERAGLYLAVGYIPFEESDVNTLIDGSEDGAGRFSMGLFANAGFNAVNPLITFRCLPNMPAYHISANFDIQGPYLVTYPGAGQVYLALDAALADLADGRIDLALVGGVAHQRNFLVEHLYARVGAAEPLGDAAGFFLLGNAPGVARPRARLLEREVAYVPHDPFEAPAEAFERFEGVPAAAPASGLGAASLPVALASARASSRLVHTLATRDGIRARSVWEIA